MKSNSVMENYRNIYENEKMSDEAVAVMKQRMSDAAREKRKMSYAQTYKKLAIAVAAAVAIVIVPNTSATVAHAMGNMPLLGSFFRLVTVKEFTYDDGKNTADASVAELTVEKNEETEQDRVVKETVSEINKDIEAVTDSFIEEFKAEKSAEGYSDLKVNSELVNVNNKYVSLKLECDMTAADGYTEIHYYTIDLATGKRLELKDLFKDGADYKSLLQNEIYEQMRNEMASGSDKSYWVDDELGDDWTFDSVGDGAFFYLNDNNELVIGFNQGEVGPMSNGISEFEIPSEVISGILK